MELLTGQFGFVMWWAVMVPGRLWRAGDKWIKTAGEIFAVKEMVQHLGEPIFQDPTWQGRLIGIVIRLIRLVVGLVGQFLFLCAVVVVIGLWYLFPLLAIYEVVK